MHVQSVHSHMPRQEGEKEQAMESIVTKVALYLHSRTAPAMRFNGPRVTSDGLVDISAIQVLNNYLANA